MPSPATTPDDIKATPEHSDRTGEARSQPPATTPHQAAEPSSTRRAKGSWPRVNKWLHYATVNRERGMSTAEYAVGTIAACAFAALLYKVVSSTEVQEMLTALINRALNVAKE
ncbi:DUF4244 domain-containing protein [Nonomuraea sp. NPDC004580]|uniref:DUF4244 domain-containing protein n=1 Tax=Nonomuraea sp. NPDC004580 TaxID=3154552 RepID=UPI0033B044C6